MFDKVESLLNDFESGKLTRRQRQRFPWQLLPLERWFPRSQTGGRCQPARVFPPSASTT